MSETAAEMSPELQKFILQWGEMASHWGLNRTEAQIQALLFVSQKPLNAEEITTTLSVSRSNVSNSLKELQRWGIVKMTHVIGDRRDYFESIKEVWELFRTVVEEQKRREIDPWRRMLKETTDTLTGKEHAHAKKQVGDMLEFFETMSVWYDEMRMVPTPALRGFLKLGGKAVKLMGGK